MDLNQVTLEAKNFDQSLKFYRKIGLKMIVLSGGTVFPGIPESTKIVWGGEFFGSRRTGRNIRSNACGIGAPQGVVENTTGAQRLAMCTNNLN